MRMPAGGGTVPPGPPAPGGGVLRGLLGAVAFLTPVGGASPAGTEALAWFPAVGAVVGLAVGGVWWAGGRLWPAPVAAALAVVSDLVLTGLLHLDGLCDSADGLLPPLGRARRLEVMALPDVGAFGTVVAASTLLLRWVCLASVRPSPLLVAALWAASRTWMAATLVWVPYARPGGGLASAFRGGRTGPVPAAAGTAAALALGVAWRPLAGPLALAVGTVAAAGVVALAWRRVGGFTGDVLGAAGVIGETAGLLAACARW